AVLAVGPGVVGAPQHLAAHDPLVERKLPMRAAILEGEDLTPLGARECDRLAGEDGEVRPPGLDVLRPRQRIPEVRMKSDPAEVRFVALSVLGLHPIPQRPALSAASVATRTSPAAPFLGE